MRSALAVRLALFPIVSGACRLKALLRLFWLSCTEDFIGCRCFGSSQGSGFTEASTSLYEECGVGGPVATTGGGAGTVHAGVVALSVFDLSSTSPG